MAVLDYGMLDMLLYNSSCKTKVIFHAKAIQETTRQKSSVADVKRRRAEMKWNALPARRAQVEASAKRECLDVPLNWHTLGDQAREYHTAHVGMVYPFSFSAEMEITTDGREPANYKIKFRGLHEPVCLNSVNFATLQEAKNWCEDYWVGLLMDAYLEVSYRWGWPSR